MAWTAPMTFTANSVLTAAQLNTHLRDNLMETAPAKATQSGSIFVGTGPNSIAERVLATARVSAAETTSSTSYTNVSTAGPSVTVTTGVQALIFVGCYLQNSSANVGTAMSWEISGATTRAALDLTAISNDGAPANQPIRASNHDLMTGLTPGVNTFTAKYRVAAGTGTFGDRIITVIPL